MSIIEQATSFVMKHKMPIAIAIAAIAAIVLSFALKKKEKYYDYESTPIRIPTPPIWVKEAGDPEKSPVLARRTAGTRNANIVQTANKKKQKFDFVLYGDSITMIAADKHMDVWNKYFGQNGMKSAPLGIGGDTVQKLSWRIALGKERFVIPPKVVGLLIGINNQGVDNTNPAAKLYQFLLPYLKAVYPTTKFILIGLLPNNLGAARNANRVKANANYRLLAKKFGMQYVDISKDLVPADKTQFFDGTHPTGAGYEILYRNLQPYVMAALKGQMSSSPKNKDFETSSPTIPTPPGLGSGGPRAIPDGCSSQSRNEERGNCSDCKCE